VDGRTFIPSLISLPTTNCPRGGPKFLEKKCGLKRPLWELGDAVLHDLRADAQEMGWVLTNWLSKMSPKIRI